MDVNGISGYKHVTELYDEWTKQESEQLIYETIEIKTTQNKANVSKHWYCLYC